MIIFNRNVSLYFLSDAINPLENLLRIFNLPVLFLKLRVFFSDFLMCLVAYLFKTREVGLKYGKINKKYGKTELRGVFLLLCTG